jgi:ATP-binding cassette subfamily C protein
MSASIADWTELFTRGQAQSVAGNHPLALVDPDGVWRVGPLPVEVFAVPLRDGQPSGVRIHLCRIEPGQLLFGTPSGTMGLVAVGLPGSTVHRLPLGELRQWACAHQGAQSLAAMLEGWIERLTAGVARGRLPRTPTLIEAGVEARVPADAQLAPAQAVVWVSGTQQTARFLGKVAVSLDVPYPLPRTGWLSIADRTSLTPAATESLFSTGSVWDGLASFNQALLSCVASEADEATAVEGRRLRAKAESESGMLRGAIAQLTSVAAPGTASLGLPSPAQLPLLAACQSVGAALGIAVKAPRNFAEKTSADPIVSIARASGVRTRRVVLSERWWCKDNGPLLGFASADGQPLALLPTGPGRYVAVNPVTQVRTPVDRALHATLKPHAYTFYRSFPNRGLTVRDLVWFSLASTRRDWIYVLVLGLVGGLIGLATPLATGLIFSRIIPGAETRQLWLVVLSLAASTLVATLLEFTQGIALLRLETRMDSSVEAAIWDRLLNLPASFFRQFAAGDLADRAMGIGRIRQVLTQAAMSTLLTFVFSLVSFGLLFYYDVRLALVASALFLAIVLVTALASWFQLRFERQSHAVHGKVVAVVLQLLSGISRLRVAAAENRALAFWARHFSHKTRVAFQAQTVSNVLATFSAAVPVVSSLAVFAVVGMASDPLPLGTFLAFNAAFVQIVFAAVMMSNTVGSILEIVPLSERAAPILTALPESYRAQRDPGTLTGDIEISHVAFRYDPHGPLVLDDVTITIRPGEFVALVGPSGAGKSTILRLLLGFEVPSSGSVYYNGEDLVGLDLQAVRRQMGVVLQSNRLTPGDLFTNITGGAPQFTLDDAWEAARLAGLERDIKQMPMGMYTVVTEAEGTLSGGQRQRLMIARAVVAKPRILLFDEATSALDNATQAQVAQSLARLKSTRIVIAHRLSTVVGADRIYVIERGRVAQHGTYAELLERPGLFADLARRQLV